ncbi:42753_t:CDS:1, partial [Gigaspora margarita]
EMNYSLNNPLVNFSEMLFVHKLHFICKSNLTNDPVKYQKLIINYYENGSDINISLSKIRWKTNQSVIIHNEVIDWERANSKPYDFLTNRGVNKYTNIDFIKEMQKYFFYLTENKIKYTNNDEYEMLNPILKLDEIYFPYRIFYICH